MTKAAFETPLSYGANGLDETNPSHLDSAVSLIVFVNVY